MMSLVLHANGTIFVIDRCLNEIYLYSDGQAHKIITNSRARSITDNTYTYARDKDYYTCANKTFAQIETLMQGKRIAEPMRYLCSALLAIVAALFLNLFFAAVEFTFPQGRPQTGDDRIICTDADQ